MKGTPTTHGSLPTSSKSLYYADAIRAIVSDPAVKRQKKRNNPKPVVVS
jgi:hypothetical protein